MEEIYLKKEYVLNCKYSKYFFLKEIRMGKAKGICFAQ